MRRTFFLKLLCAIMLCVFTSLLCFGCTALTALSEHSGGVIINEVVTSNSHSLVDELVGSPDWIELYNSSPYTISLFRFGLSDNIREPRKWVFPDINLASGEYIIIYATSYKDDLPEGKYCAGFGLSKAGESLYLTDRSLNIVDEVDIPSLYQDISYARDEAGSFGFCALPTPGSKNSDKIVASIEDISYALGEESLILSEAVPNNQSGLKAADGRCYPWAELHNNTAQVLPLAEYWLSDNPQNFMKWQLPDYSLQPGQRIIVFFSGKSSKSGELNAGFRLSDDDSALYISNGRGTVIGELSWESPAAGNIAVVRSEGANKYTAFPTPGEQNDERRFSSMKPVQMEQQDPVILNEVLPKNRYSVIDSDGDRPEWAELYNRSETSVSLLGYYLSDDEDRLTKWALPDIQLGAGEYLLVYLSGKDRLEGELHASFGLSKRDSALFFTNLDGLRYDSLPLPTDIGQNISIGRDLNYELKYFAVPTPCAKNDSKGFEEPILVPNRNPDGVIISEVCAVNPAKSRKRDWVEFYNPTNSEKSLTGWYISDDISTPDKYKIKSLTVPPKGYALLYASSRTSLQGENTATFGISASGETLLLTDSKGITRDWFTTGVLRPSNTSGRDVHNASGERVFFETPTPSAQNTSACYKGYAGAPVFSQAALYNKEPFLLEMSTSTPEGRIFYSLDGSKPTEASHEYTAPINISQNTPVRAITLAPGLLKSEITTSTFLFEAPHTVPVVCLSGDPSAISAVYAATERSQRVEREGYMEFYETEGLLGASFPCGLRANGSSTLTLPQKSLSVFLRGGYGRSSVNYPFFKDYEITSFSSLTLRSGGQDRPRARLRDSYFSLAAEGLYVDNIATRPVVMYLNGRYWGIYDLNENQNEDYLKSHYGVDPDEVDIIRRNVQALAGQNLDYKRVRAFGRGRNLGDDATYAQFCEWVDMDYLIDYLITQTFFANSDMFNQKYWRSWDYKVKWRPVLYDMDLGFSASNPTRDILPSYFKYEGVPSRDGSLTNMDLYCGLPANAAWRERFVKRYVYVVMNHYTPERLTKLLDEVASELKPEMKRHLERWNTHASVSAWETSVKELRSCLEKRPQYALKALARYFNISDAKLEEYKREATASGLA